MSRPFYVTTPIYYVNDSPHIGHAYTTIAAEFLTRFHRLAGREAFFLTGTDEHGSKVADAAQAAGLTEIEFCDRTVETFKTAWRNLRIANDYFIRTTSPRHEKAVVKILDAMRRAKTADGRDVVYSGTYEGLYCTGCEKFLTEKELVDDLCPDHLKKPERVTERNYFFRLSAFLPQLKELIESEKLLILPEERRREVLGLIKQDLPDFSLSRERVKWGIRLPFDPSQVAYVWVDALSNYISAIGYGDDPQTFDRWWNRAEVVHLMAKDILKFHCLYWPAMLLAAGVKLPDVIFLHGFFTVDGQKMSKSLGNKIDPNEMVARFGPDATRYLLLTQYPFGIDGDIQASRFVTQYNADLANDLGNLVSRVAKLIATNFDGKLPGPYADLSGLAELRAQSEAAVQAAAENVHNFRLGQVIGDAMSLVRAANKFFNDTAPWVLAKEGKTAELGGVLNACCEVLRIVSVLLTPVMPYKMAEVRAVLALDDSTLTLDEARRFERLCPGTPIRLADAICPRLQAGKEAAAKQQVPTAETATADNLLDIAEFARAELIVAVVLQAERVPGADKLLKLQIDIGTEKRQIVAGIAEHYAPEMLIGRRIIVVANLKPARIRGIESRGMLLAAHKGKQLVIVTPDGDAPAGSKVS